MIIFPNLLKRMWIGLFFSLLSAISVTVIGYNFITNFTEKNLPFEATNTTSVCQDVWPYYMLLVPEILSGVGLFFSLTSQFEFIYIGSSTTKHARNTCWYDILGVCVSLPCIFYRNCYNTGNKFFLFCFHNRSPDDFHVAL